MQKCINYNKHTRFKAFENILAKLVNLLLQPSKNFSKNGVTNMSNNEIKLRPTKGKITFNDNIILSVINLATKEIAGVSSINNKYMNILKRWFSKNYAEGVKISYLNNSMTVDVYINVYFGYNVSEIAYRVQENIKNSIASMIDINIDKINVHVIGVDFSKSEDSDV